MTTETKLDVTAQTIDFGSKVVALRHVVSVGFNRGRPFFLAGLLMIAAAAGLLGYDLALGKGLKALRSGGSTVIWIALVVLGVGVFSLVFQRRALTIAMADGAKIHLPAGREDFVRSVVSRLGEVLRADPGSPVHYRFDLTAETVEIVAPAKPLASTPLTPHDMPMAEPYSMDRPAGRDAAARPQEWQRPAGAPGLNGSSPHANGVNPGGHWTPNSPIPANGHHPSAPGSPPVLTHGGPGFHASPSGTGAPILNPYATGGSGALGGAANGRAQPPMTPNPKRELDALIAFVVRSDIQHKTALMDLLHVVGDHLQTGETSRADAVAHWQSFASYVDQYLTGVDGLVPLTRRVGRNFTHA